MRKTFALNTVPHEAEIGDVVLKFIPEAPGDQFLDQYEQLRDVQKRASGDDASPDAVREVTAALREFITSLMLPESHETFDGLELPTRILVQLVEWLAELYGSGAGGEAGGQGRPTGRSSGSARPQRTPGTR